MSVRDLDFDGPVSLNEALADGWGVPEDIVRCARCGTYVEIDETVVAEDGRLCPTCAEDGRAEELL